MKTQKHRLTVAVAGLAMLGSSLGASSTVTLSRASAATSSDYLVGEGGSFLAPVVNALENADPNQSAPYSTYQDTDIDAGVADFTGTSLSTPGLNADFAVTERPLTAAEAAGASANGRNFAYVPFAATPVAIADLAFCHTPQVSDPVVASNWCHSIKVTPTDIAQIIESSYGVGAATNPLQNWGQLTQTNGSPIPSTQSFGFANVLGHQQENQALLAWIDSDANAKSIFDNVLAASGFNVDNATDAPSEIWPMQTQRSYAGGDVGMIEKEIDINPANNAPADAGQWVGLGAGNTPLTSGDAFPVSAAWTIAPQGTPWNLPTAALPNAANAYVAPTEAAAAEAEAAQNITLDPTTNLVTFNASKTDATAYNSTMMAESYLVVPTSGLPAAKASKLAQFIRYILGPNGQTLIKQYGVAPATPAEVTAGLNVAAQLSQEAASAPSSAIATGTTSSSSTTTTVATTGSTGASGTTGSSSAGMSATPDSAAAGGSSGLDSSGVSNGAGSTGAGSSGSDSSLAFTGPGALVPITAIGLALFFIGIVRRRRLIRSRTAVASLEGAATHAESGGPAGWVKKRKLRLAERAPESRLVAELRRKKVGP